MNFGRYIKEQRSSLGITQPEAAEKIGIEQSYLSKLETGKSTPSDEIFNKIQDAYQFDVNEMADLIDSKELLKLTEVSSVKESIQALERKKVTTTKSWLIAGLILIMLGGGLLGAAMVPDVEESSYLYRSMGILLPGEELKTFSHLDWSNIDDVESREKLLKRVSQKDLVLDKLEGLSFVKESDEGRRYYKYVNNNVSKQPFFPRWLIIPAIAFLLGGLGCFYIARVWRKKN